MPPKDKYTDPKLRDEIKEELHNSDKGGAPGQWSARKAQMMASEYKKRGGEYNTDKSEQDESQKHLSKWSEEDWQTKEGSGNAKQPDGTQKRYLPKKAWDKMSEEEKRATEEEKQDGSKEGKQHVPNTDKAKESRKEANEEEDEEFEKRKDEEKQDKPGKGKRSSPRKKANGTESKEEKNKDEENDEARGTKRSRNDSASPDKRRRTTSGSKDDKPKSNEKVDSATIGSKHDSAAEPAPQGSNKRLPKKGQKVHWKSLPGWVEGEVLEIVKEKKSVEGKEVKATKEEPRIVLRSHAKSGKVAVHKPEAVYFE
ncbi:hypothetical protein K461DRAFT_309326 [Myriangium duriaei CBS 260.36]|uniref:Hypervirulence associated protein TUDOR domain-containing protein n=1 Tax=Myriangium duriaei CBS 260.36 TaxID=1168546 RepID=A0A9P4J884_9PEZI|nr:hypothetical protein K461DRAFT_309326 [Myriangium duriaei CBS 260.36]